MENDVILKCSSSLPKFYSCFFVIFGAKCLTQFFTSRVTKGHHLTVSHKWYSFNGSYLRKATSNKKSHWSQWTLSTVAVAKHTRGHTNQYVAVIPTSSSIGASLFQFRGKSNSEHILQWCGLRLWSCCKTFLRRIEFGLGLDLVNSVL